MNLRYGDFGMNDNEIINIVVASDDNYVPHLMTLIESIGANNRQVNSILIHVFDGGMTSEAKRRIDNMKKNFHNISFQFYKMTEKIIREKLGGGIQADRSLSAYARIFIPELIKSDKVLYFDVDAIVLNDLRELYQIDISEMAIAGVVDTNPIQRHHNVGLNDNDVYINSGMILWNIRKCREIQFTKQCLDFISNRQGKVDAMDQGTINGVLGKIGMIQVLPPQYNVMTSLFQLRKSDILRLYRLPDYYSDDEIFYAKEHPVFVHFTPNMTTRPWEQHCTHPFRDMYWKYRLEGMGEEKVLSNDNRTLKLRILGWIYRKLVQLVPAIVYVFRLIILVVYIRGHYTFLDKNVPPNYNISKKRWNALVHQVTNLVVNNTDSIVLSKAVGYSSVSIYSIYQMVVSNINGFLTQALSNAITANFGHLFVEKDLEKSVKAYDYYEKIYYYIISIIFSGCAVALYPFINLYIGEVNGLKYADYKLVILFVINAILCNLRIPQLTIVTAVGHFKETQWHAIAEAICNVLVSVILVKKLGIYGVLIGTTCSYLIRDIMFIVYVNKNIFYRNLTSTVKNLTKMVTLFTMTVCCGIIISKFIGPDTWIKWGVVSATTFVIGVIFVSIYLLMFDREIFSLILNVIGVNKIMKGKNKKNLSHK